MQSVFNLIEGWWRVFRHKAFAGQSLANDHDIAAIVIKFRGCKRLTGRIEKPLEAVSNLH